MEALRAQIDVVDEEIRQLFEKRMELAGKIGLRKVEKGLEIYDPAREKFLLSRNCSYFEDKNMAQYYFKLLSTLLDLSRDHQYKLTGRNK